MIYTVQFIKRSIRGRPEQRAERVLAADYNVDLIALVRSESCLEGWRVMMLETPSAELGTFVHLGTIGQHEPDCRVNSTALHSHFAIVTPGREHAGVFGIPTDGGHALFSCLSFSVAG